MEHLDVADLKKLLHANQIDLREFIRLSGELSRRDAASHDASNDAEVEVTGAVRIAKEMLSTYLSTFASWCATCQHQHLL